MEGLRLHGLASLWWLKLICGTRVEVRGREKLPDGACLVAAKHQSAWDTFALIPVFRDPAMVMKAELGWIPLYGWFSHKFQHIFVKRDRGPSALKAMIRDARERASQGREIVIFPEGTRRPPGAPPDYKPGFLALYEGLGLPCVPAGAQLGAVLAAAQLHALPRHHRHRSPRCRPAGAAARTGAQPDPGAHRDRLRPPDRRGTQDRPIRRRWRSRQRRRRRCAPKAEPHEVSDHRGILELEKC